MKNTFIYKKQIYKLVDGNAIIYKKSLYDKKEIIKNEMRFYNTWTSKYVELSKRLKMVNNEYSEAKKMWVLAQMAIKIEKGDK